MTERLISVVLPVYNQADHITEVVEQYEETLGRLKDPHETILVVNGSRDRSLAVCQTLAERFPNVRVLHSVRGGWGLAVKLGLRAARGDVLCYTNSARTEPSTLALMILIALNNPDMLIKAHRRDRDSLVRRLGSFLYNVECRWLFDLATWDVNATPKVFPRALYEAIALESDGDLIDAELYAKCRRRGIVVLEVPVYAGPRVSGESTTGYMSAARLYLGAFRLWRRTRRCGASR